VVFLLDSREYNISATDETKIPRNDSRFLKEYPNYLSKFMQGRERGKRGILC
jgi:hypothetical protein